MFRTFGALTVATLVAMPAHALTAPELWADWQDVAERIGGTLTATEDYADGTLTLDDTTWAMTIMGVENVSNYGSVQLVERDDGSVEVVVPAEVSIASSGTIEGETFETTDTITHVGLSLVAREEGGERVYDYTAEEIAYVVQDPSGGTEEGFPTLTMTFTDYASTYRSGIGGDSDAFAQDMTLANLRFALDDAAADGDATFTYDMESVAGDVTGRYPDAPPKEGSSMFGSGFAFAATLTHEGTTLDLDAQSPEGAMVLRGGAASGRWDVGLDGDVIRYDIGSQDATLSVQPPGMPMAFDVAMASARSAFSFPMGQTEEAAPFGLTVDYQDLTLGDAVWSMFDPTGQLPRDPATLTLDLSGTANILVDVFGDPEAMIGMTEPPVLPETLDLSTLLVRFGGAELRGDGSVEFPAGQFPFPVGRVDLALDGGMTLLDRLVAMGLVPPAQATGIRAMSGVVMRSVGEDMMESTIEFTPGGGITANGLPLQ
ncbi:hypothetical protein [Jannaschia sp. LMIT008]|uniref:hypothetical protein n=1 Tax=Jannaschia maritima TaxID=3032585 RepID=UPI0028119E04|nr:hypothetical protein [Jannaschia sp. LMIT008]